MALPEIGNIIQVFVDYYEIGAVEKLEVMLMLIESKDKGKQRMPLSSELLSEVSRLHQYMQNISVTLKDGSLVRFADMNSKRGDINVIFHYFKFAFDAQMRRLAGNESLSDSINLDYPFSDIYGHRLPLYHSFFGVRTYQELNSTLTNPSPAHPSSIESVETIALWYILQMKDPMTRIQLRQMEMELFDVSKKGNFSSLFDFHTYGDELGNYEMLRGGQKTVNLISVGMLLMIIFMLIALHDLPWRSQVLLISASIISPLFAIVTTFALMGWLGFGFNSGEVTIPRVLTLRTGNLGNRSAMGISLAGPYKIAENGIVFGYNSGG